MGGDEEKPQLGRRQLRSCKCIRLKNLCRNVVSLRRYIFKNVPVVDGQSGNAIFYAVWRKSLTQLGEMVQKSFRQRWLAYSAERLIKTRKGRCSALNCCMFLSFNRLRLKETCSSRTQWRQSTNSTVTPGLTILASSVASQLVRRTQPWLWVLPILEGSGVP